MAGLGGRKSRSFPRGPVCRPREVFAAGEGHLAFGAMVAGGSKRPDVEVAPCLAFESDVEMQWNGHTKVDTNWMTWTCSFVCETDNPRHNLFREMNSVMVVEVQVLTQDDGRREQRLAERVTLHLPAKMG